MDRHWFFTWRTYGSWLPGEEGFVGFYVSDDGRRVIDNGFRMPTSEAMPHLEAYARSIQSGDTLLLADGHSPVLLRQFQETAAYRGWVLDAVAVMTTHVHLVFGVPGDPDHARMLHDWKSYASRALNVAFGHPPASRWWAESGSRRILKRHEDRLAAIKYVRDQESPLLVWMSEEAIQFVGVATTIDGLSIPPPVVVPGFTKPPPA